MRLHRFFTAAVVCLLIVGLLGVSVCAAQNEETIPDNEVMSLTLPLATGSFNMTIPANTKLSANYSFPLAAGETVTIKASYSPFSASVDFGLLAPNGMFYYFNITNGSIDKTIRVNESGRYTLQIRNNSNFEVDVAGFVNY